METILDQDIIRLIREHPLAWVLPQDQGVFPVLLPMLVECDATGAPVSLLGHVPKAHPLAVAFKSDGRARFLFLGPHGYISPELVSNKDWAPTWNYAALQIDGDVTIDEKLTDEALGALVEQMEQGRASPWSVSMLGDRYDLLRARVVGFRARISNIHARFKLGQDESQTAFGEIVDCLSDPDLSSWMKRFRPAD
ncbi:FMN-binding negative transcriptional regulator [Marinicaulis aureus]|uniref:FMN-binding negative transcriptional regulator n=1 Tax=Hyphococcus aureus TaxID=2666033 RepID=A0ABW1L2E7_9PROT